MTNQARRILIVDDEADMAHMLRVILEAKGYFCSTAENARDGLQIILDERPALAIFDYMMPGMTGADAFRLLRRIETYTDVREMPVIILTAKNDNEEEQKELTALGLAAYLTKPFSYQKLLQTIEDLIGSR